MKTNWVVLGSMALVLAACGGANESLENADVGGKVGNAPADCGSAWNQHVAAHPQGRVEEFKTETRMIMGGRVINRSTSRDSTRVVESNAERVSLETSADRGRPSTSTLTRAQFLIACTNGAPQGVPVDSTVEILEQKNESVTVVAGTFECAYVKMRARTGEGSAIIESWTDSAGTTVKTRSVTDMNADGETMQVITERELTRRG